MAKVKGELKALIKAKICYGMALISNPNSCFLMLKKRQLHVGDVLDITNQQS